MKIEVLFEDDELVAVNKPAGLLVHPAPGHEGAETLAGWFARRYPQAREVGSADRPGIVHRLDRDTSGVMVLAKTPSSYRKLRRLFEAHEQVRKVYLAIMHGTPKPRQGAVTEPIKGRPAVSHYRVLGAHDGVSLVEWVIETGRTHQIRIHAAKLGHPLVGDTLYGSRQKDRALRRLPKRTLLHAVALEFPGYSFAAQPPLDIVEA